MNRQLYYCTVSQTRGLSAEMPIGDPYGFGKKQMPVVAVAMGGASFAAGAGAIAAGATGLSAVMAGAMMVGGALSVIGTITGNQKLAKIGGIISLVGGVGSMLNNAFGAAAEGAASASASSAAEIAAAGDIGVGLPTDVGAGAASLSAEGAASIQAMNAADAASLGSDVGSTGLIGSSSGGGSSAAAGGGSVANQVAPTTGDAAANSLTENSTFLTQGPDAFSTPKMNALDADVNSALNIDTGLINSGNTNINPLTGLPMQRQIGPNGELGFLDRFGRWTRENPELTKIGGQAIAGIAGNLVQSPKDKAITDLYNQRVADDRRRALWGRGLIG